MAIRDDPKGQQFPAIQGRVIVDTYRGKIRVRSWPSKPKKKPSRRQEIMRQWFKETNRNALRKPAIFQEVAMKAAKGTGLYPRDIMVQAAGGGFFVPITEDGQTREHRWPQVHDVTFQGFRLERTSNKAMAAATNTAIDWQDPVLDTANFWNAGSPTLITIPEFAEVMTFQAGAVADVFNSSTWGLAIQRVSPALGTVGQARGIRYWSNTVATGALPVSQGETYRVMVQIPAAGNVLGVEYTFFSGQLIGAST